MKSKRHNLLLTGIATALGTLVTILVIVTSIGLDGAAAFAISFAVALAVFGAFVYKFYVMKERVATVSSNEVTQHCLILAAPTHGVLQDRVNHWLSGKYGAVKSTAMSATEKGFYLAIFYETIEIKELPLKEAQK